MKEGEETPGWRKGGAIILILDNFFIIRVSLLDLKALSRILSARIKMKKRSTLEIMVRTSRHLSAEEILSVVYQQSGNSPFPVDLDIEKEALDELAIKSKEPLIEL